MSDTNLDKLKQEAEGLNIKFRENIGEDKLKAKIDAYYDAEAEKSRPVLLKTNTEDTEIKQQSVTPKAGSKLQQAIDAMKKKAWATRVVTITSLDKQANDEATTCYLTFENLYFGLAKVVPLDIPVELEQGLIDSAKERYIQIHVPEVDAKGKKTGNRTPKMTKAFAIQFEDK